MKAMINKTHIEGILYEHDLELKTSGPNSKNPGTEFISGTVSIATDDAGVNVVPVHFTYVTATTAKGNANATFTTLKNIIDGVIGTQMKDGKDKAGKLRIDSALGLNEFYSDRNGKEELVSAKRNEGGFVHTCDVLNEDEKTRNTFECDMLITNCRRSEADPDKNIAEKVIVKGAIFDFRKSLLPIEFTALNPNAMNYFEDLGASQSNPVFTKVWGRQVSETVVKKTVEESAFGEASVRTFEKKVREWIVSGCSREGYNYGDEEVLTYDDIAKAIANREVNLAEMKKRSEEYKASAQTAAPIVTPAAPKAKAGGFNF